MDDLTTLQEFEENCTVKGVIKKYRKIRKKLFNGHCCYCLSKPHIITLDHFIPKSKAGRHHPLNLVPCCEKCNREKSNTLPSVWYAGQSFYSSEQWEKILTIVGDEERDRLTVQETDICQSHNQRAPH